MLAEREIQMEFIPSQGKKKKFANETELLLKSTALNDDENLAAFLVQESEVSGDDDDERFVHDATRFMNHEEAFEDAKRTLVRVFPACFGMFLFMALAILVIVNFSKANAIGAQHEPYTIPPPISHPRFDPNQAKQPNNGASTTEG